MIEGIFYMFKPETLLASGYPDNIETCFYLKSTGKDEMVGSLNNAFPFPPVHRFKHIYQRASGPGFNLYNSHCSTFPGNKVNFRLLVAIIPCNYYVSLLLQVTGRSFFPKLSSRFLSPINSLISSKLLHFIEF
jgi:hypothetical protein